MGHRIADQRDAGTSHKPARGNTRLHKETGAVGSVGALPLGERYCPPVGWVGLESERFRRKWDASLAERRGKSGGAFDGFFQELAIHALLVPRESVLFMRSHICP